MQRKYLLVFLSVFFLAMAFWIAGAKPVFRDLNRFVFTDLMWIVGLLGLNLFVTLLRLKRILSHFRIALPLQVAAKACVSGHVASLFVFSLFGQVFGRHLVLREYGVGPVVIASLFAYERTILFLLGSGLGVAGATWLLGEHAILDFLKSMPLLQVILAAGGGMVLGFVLLRSKFEGSVLYRVFSLTNVLNVLEISFVTLAGQLMVLGGFVIGIVALQPNIDILDAMAAAAVISFAASMPLSVNGWGIRELAAVYVLGHLGVESASAVAISIIVGLCATAVIVLASPLMLGKRNEVRVDGLSNYTAIEPKAVDVEKAAALFLILVSGALVFFQMHLTLAPGTINLNLADPFAILALTVVIIKMIGGRRLPDWRSGKFNFFLLLFSVILLLSFGWGVKDIGVTQWAFGNRLIGWMVVLGYLSVGYLAIVYLGAWGRRRLYATIASTAVVIIVFQILIRWADYSGLLMGLDMPANFEGYSANRNAFAFQLLISLVLLISFSMFNRKTGSVKIEKVIPPLIGLITAGIILTGSRAGMITSVILMACVLLLQWIDRRVIVMGLVYAFLVWMSAHILWLLPKVYLGGGQSGLLEFGVKSIGFHSRLSDEMSNIERWNSIFLGLQMWLDSPIVGAGLGVFIERSAEWSDHPVVIHSTLVWLLAEFGLVGAGLCLWGLVILLAPIYTRRARGISDRTIVLLLLVFVMFGLVHEIFYQRIFWMVLGSALACMPITNNVPETKETVKARSG